GQIRSQQDRMDAGVSLRFRNINIDDARMRNRTAQEPGVQHSRKHDVICVLQLADALCFGIDLDEGFSNDIQSPLAAVIPSHTTSPWRAPLARRAYERPPVPPLPVF